MAIRLVIVFTFFFVSSFSYAKDNIAIYNTTLEKQKVVKKSLKKAHSKKDIRAFLAQEKRQQRKARTKRRTYRSSLIQRKQQQRKTIATRRIHRSSLIQKKRQQRKARTIKRIHRPSLIHKKQQVIAKKKVESSSIDYFSLLHPHNKKNAVLGGLQPLFSKNLLGKGQTVAFVEYSGTWKDLQDTVSKGGIVPARKRQIYKDNFLPVRGKGPNNNLHSLSEGVEEYARDHGALVASYFLDFSPQAKVLPVSTYYSPVDPFYDVADALLELSRNKEVSVVSLSGYSVSNLPEVLQIKDNLSQTVKYQYKLTFPKKLTDAFKAVTKAGKAIVIATGNEAQEIPLHSPVILDESKWDYGSYLLHLLENLDNETKQCVIFAGNLHPDTLTPSWSSNKAGKRADAQDRFLFAPAGKLHVSYSAQVIDGGTSCAAPFISAALANLLSRSKAITPKRAVKALLESAEIQKDKTIYGRGIIKTHKALEFLEKEIGK
jgi:hypothetical protein